MQAAATLNRTKTLLGVAVAALLAACSHTPTATAPTVEKPTAQAVTPPPTAMVADAESAAKADPITVATAEGDVPLDTQAPLSEPEEPKTAEEAVAMAVAEQNLLDRIRAGFAMTDAEHVAIDREVAWFARNDLYLDRTFRRAERYLFFIVEELEARKMPLELALLPIVESAFNPVALSRARAAGLWQFIPSTGRRYGLEQNHRYDGRRDVTESTRAALDYLQFLADEFDGNWHHAVAAYNSGEMNVARAIARNKAAGRPTDFFSLDLPRETRAYVPKLLAMRRIVAEPEKYGLEFGHMPNQPYFAKVELTAPIDLEVAARLAQLPKEDLIALNPAHYRAVVSEDGPGFLLVPVDRAEQLRAGLEQLKPSERVPKIYYKVHRGDTVSTIAKKLGVTQAELRAANNLKSNTLRVGQELIIVRGSAIRSIAPEPLPGTRVVTRDPAYVAPPTASVQTPRALPRDSWHVVRSGETLWSLARAYRISPEAIARENKVSMSTRLSRGQKLWIPSAYEGETTLAANDSSGTVQRVTYVVRAGDTLSKVARMFRVEISQLLNWNKLRNANAIRPGQKLVMYVDDVRRTGG